MSRQLRRKPRISYYEIEEPDLDEYVFCDECRDYVFEYCAIHGPLLVLPDDKVPSPTGFPDFVPRAALTVPSEFLHLARSNIPGAGLGVFATLTLPKGVRFGPYRGVRTKDASSDYCWQIYAGSTGRKPLCVVDAADAARSNWMRYVNCSRHCAEQNLLAYQYQGELYYRTIRLVPRFSELLVFYGAEFARSLRVNMKLYNRPEGCLQLIGNVSKRPKLDNNPSTMVEETGVNTELPSHSKSAEKADKKETPRNSVDENKLSNCEDKRHIENAGPSKLVTENNEDKIDTNGNLLESKTAERLYFACDICGKKLTEKGKLKRHLTIHMNERVYFPCDICDKKFTEKSSLKLHLTIHMNERVYFPCDICDKKFTQKGNLIRHLTIHMNERVYFPCDICDKKFTRKGDLKGHLTIHMNERVYFPCDICDKKFTQKGNLKQHRTAHMNERVYFPCDICDKKFTQKEHLKRHRTIHMTERVYFPCDICDKKFTEESSLRRHLPIHTNERVYFPCDICDKKFTEKGSLRRHLTIHTTKI